MGNLVCVVFFCSVVDCKKNPITKINNAAADAAQKLKNPDLISDRVYPSTAYTGRFL